MSWHYTYVAIADAEGCSSFFFPVPGPYCPIKEPSSVNRPVTTYTIKKIFYKKASNKHIKIIIHILFLGYVSYYVLSFHSQ